MKIIKYVAFYSDTKDIKQNRQAVLAATNKINYICSALIRNGYQVQIISPGWTNNQSGFYSGNKVKLSENITLHNFFTFSSRIKFIRMFKYLLAPVQLFLYLLKNTKKEEPVLVYHSVILSLPVYLAKLFRKFKLVLEVEEIYSDVKQYSTLTQKIEFKTFKTADRYLVSTELLNQRINPARKPAIVIYGTYQAEEARDVKFDDNKIHVVYSGTFDPRKGAITAVFTAPYLPAHYHIHILGFGSENEKANLIQKVQEVSKISEALVTYDGILAGEDYIRFLQKCHIGLSTQAVDASFNNTSFPSKILAYLSNGLRVISVKIKTIEISPVGKTLYYYEDQSPQAIANAILSIDFDEPYDSRQLIRELDIVFAKDLKKIIEQ